MKTENQTIGYFLRSMLLRIKDNMVYGEGEN